MAKLEVVLFEALHVFVLLCEHFCVCLFTNAVKVRELKQKVAFLWKVFLFGGFGGP